MGAGLVWIGAVEGTGYGLFLEIVGAIFILAGIMEIWAVEAAGRQLRRETTMTTIHPAVVTCDIPVFYATSEGQTRRIAERLVAIFRENGFTSRAVDVASSEANYVDWRRAQAAVVGASLHAHKHQRSARTFVDEHASDLNVRPSAFFSVSLAAASESVDEREEAARIRARVRRSRRVAPGRNCVPRRPSCVYAVRVADAFHHEAHRAPARQPD